MSAQPSSSPFDYTKFANYRRWGTLNDYAIATGQFVVPLAVSQDDVEAGVPTHTVVQAHQPIALRQVRFDARKKGGPPVIPKPADSGPFTFLEGNVQFVGPAIGTNGYGFDWEVRGSYTFVQDARFDADDGFVLTGFPFPLDVQYANQAQFSGNLPELGPVPECGADVQAGYAQGQAIDLTSPYWRYNTITYFPPQLLNGDMVIGGVPAVPATGIFYDGQPVNPDAERFGDDGSP